MPSELGTVLVTGGASGLGAAVAEAVRDEGGTPVVLDVKEPPDGLAFERVDLARARDTEEAVRRIAEERAGLDAVVTAAGIDACGDLGDIDGDDWDRVIAVNLVGTAAVVRAALPYLARSRGRSTRARRSAGCAPVSPSRAGCGGTTRAARSRTVNR